MCEDDIEDINSISLDIKNFCEMNTKLLYYRQKLAELIGESVVDSWLNSPNKAFNNKKPIDMINKEDTELLDEMIYYKKKEEE